MGGCDRPITACNGFGLARDVIACQDGKRKEFPRELCGVCVEKAVRHPGWFEQRLQITGRDP
jgi:hypothetical protein